MSAFDKLLPASFEGIAFVVDDVEVKGGLRDHVHEYPRVPGGSPEKLGRKLYEITMSANFQATFAKYPTAWPLDLQRLRALFEAETTGQLVIPTIGTMNAYCVNWSQTMVAKIRSGERAKFTFREDQSDAFVMSKLVGEDTHAFVNEADSGIFVLTQAITPLSSYAIAFPTEKDKRNYTDIFTAITQIVNVVLGLFDQVELYGAYIEAKLLGLVSLLRRLDRDVVALNHPSANAIVDALHALQDAAQRLLNDLHQKGLTTRSYTVPTRMSVSQISVAIYGDASHAVEILQLNPIENGFSVPAGTKIRIYEPN